MFLYLFIRGVFGLSLIIQSFFFWCWWSRWRVVITELPLVPDGFLKHLRIHRLHLPGFITAAIRCSVFVYFGCGDFAYSWSIVDACIFLFWFLWCDLLGVCWSFFFGGLFWWLACSRFFCFFFIRRRIYLLTGRNLLWDILRLPSSRRAAIDLYVILTLWRGRGANQPPYALLHRSSPRHALRRRLACSLFFFLSNIIIGNTSHSYKTSWLGT